MHSPRGTEAFTLAEIETIEALAMKMDVKLPPLKRG